MKYLILPLLRFLLVLLFPFGWLLVSLECLWHFSLKPFIDFNAAPFWIARNVVYRTWWDFVIQRKK